MIYKMAVLWLSVALTGCVGCFQHPVRCTAGAVMFLGAEAIIVSKLKPRSHQPAPPPPDPCPITSPC